MVETTAFFISLGLYQSQNTPLTTEFRQPDCFWFVSEAVLADIRPGNKNIIHMHSDNTNDCPVDSGLYLDLDCFLVMWSHGITRPNSLWVPLESALMKALEMCKPEKCVLSNRFWTTAGLFMAPWTAEDLNARIVAMGIPSWMRFSSVFLRFESIGTSRSLRSGRPV